MPVPASRLEWPAKSQAARSSFHGTPDHQSQADEQPGQEDGDAEIIVLQLDGEVQLRGEPVEDLVEQQESADPGCERNEHRNQVISNMHSRKIRTRGGRPSSPA